MIEVAGVRFKNCGKVYYFDPCQLDVKLGDKVIVETARGQEFGTVAMDIKEVREEQIASELKPIIRIATPEDEVHHKENEKKKARALELCQEKIGKHGLEMKLIDVEYTFDNNKVIFYFTADGRVDFRELVKDLASVFRMRIELRQVGVRDEAKILGGVGCCGRSLCCNSWLSEFQPVSIKMAKTQNLSLNPTKISGVCGRLMCCLKYENDVYLQLKKGMPEVGERVKTRDGMGKVVDTSIFSESVKVRHFTGEKNEDGSEKLTTDVTTYHKDQVKRLGDRVKGSRSDDILGDVDEELRAELKKLIKE